MIDFGESRPASGMEHHISHHLEMKIVWDNLSPVLHGAKVGVATLTVAGYYDQIRQLSPQDAQIRLDAAPMPDPNADIEQIKKIYPSIADRLVAAQAPFLQMSEQDYRQQKQKIVEVWPQIQEIAAHVPPPQELENWLGQVSAATTMPQLGLSQAETERAINNSHFLRNRFTVAKLSRMLGML
jgi:glycerol-1-phosphate dehydrogenase [NAD(P)+]